MSHRSLSSALNVCFAPQAVVLEPLGPRMILGKDRSRRKQLYRVKLYEFSNGVRSPQAFSCAMHIANTREAPRMYSLSLSFEVAGFTADYFLRPRYLTPTPWRPSNRNSIPCLSRANRSFSIVRSEPGSSEFSMLINFLPPMPPSSATFYCASPTPPP